MSIELLYRDVFGVCSQKAVFHDRLLISQVTVNVQVKQGDHVVGIVTCILFSQM